jgi:hypothetical protein
MSCSLFLLLFQIISALRVMLEAEGPSVKVMPPGEGLRQDTSFTEQIHMFPQIQCWISKMGYNTVFCIDCLR